MSIFNSTNKIDPYSAENDWFSDLKKSEIIVFDFTSHYYGDKVGGFFLSNYLEKVQSQIEKILSNVWEDHEINVFLPEKDYIQPFRDFFSDKGYPQFKIHVIQNNACFSDVSYRKENNLFWIDIFSFISLFRIAGVKLEDDSLISIQGMVTNPGVYWYSSDSTISEVVQVKAENDLKVDGLWINGPAGELYLWDQIKEKKLSEFKDSVRSLHLMNFSSGEEVLKMWNTFFIKDECNKCMPCFLEKSNLKEKRIANFPLSMDLKCKLPKSYLKGLAKIQRYAESEVYD